MCNKFTGLMIDLYKDPMFSSDCPTLCYNNDDVCAVTWMHYDAVRFHSVNLFSDFFYPDDNVDPFCFETDAFDCEKDGRMQHGDLQTLRLYRENDNECENRKFFRLLTKEEQRKHNCFFKKDECDINTCNFICVVCLNVLGKNEDSRSELIKKIREDPGAKCDYQIFKTLGPEDLVILLYGDSIKDFIKTITHIRNISTQSAIVATSFSFVVSNRIFKSDDDIKQSTLTSDVDISISVTLIPGTDNKEFFEGIKKGDKFFNGKDINIFQTTGKYDYVINISGKENPIALRPFFDKDCTLCNENKKYQKSVFQMKTIWMSSVESESDIEEDPSEIKFDIDMIRNEKYKEIKENIKRIQEKISKIKQHKFFKGNGCNEKYTADLRYMSQMLNLLYTDFRKQTLSLYSSINSMDFCSQFEAFLDVFTELLKRFNRYGSKEASYIFDMFRKSAESFRQLYAHYTQSTRPFFDIPVLNIRYSGSFSKVLTAYYGICKELLSYMYGLCGKKQKKIIPIISFEYGQKVSSEVLGKPDNLKTRLIDIHLPYDAMMGTVKYIGYLTHELAHYFTPINVYEYNKSVLNTIMAETVLKVVRKDMISVFGLDKPEYKAIYNELVEKTVPQLYETACKCVDKLVEFIYDKENEEQKLTKHSLKAERIDEFDITKFCDWFRESFNDESFSGLVLEYYNKVWDCFKQECCQINEECGKTDIGSEHTSNNDIQGEVYNRINENKLNANEFKNKCLAEIKACIDDTGRMVVIGFNEAFSDLFVINLFGFDSKSYFTYLMRFFADTVSYIKNDTANTVRIGIIAAVFESSDESLEDIEAAINSIGSHLCQSEYGEDLIKCIKHFNYRLYSPAIDVCKKSISQNEKEFSNDSILGYLVDTYREYCKFGFKDRNRSEYQRFLYESNIVIIEKFRDQEPFPGFCESSVPEKISREKSSAEQDALLHPAFYSRIGGKIQALSSFVDSIKTGLNYITCEYEKRKPQIWFRGHTSSEYNCLPSLMRQVQGKKVDGKYIRKLQLAYMDSFETYAYGSNEFLNGIYSSNASFQSLVNMQHFSVPTNLLDWSENAFIALFFAVFDEDGKNEDKDAEVLMLNPERMNELLYLDSQNKLSLGSIGKKEYPIPNLSLQPENANTIYNRFGVNLHWSDSSKRKSMKNKSRSKLYPMACTSCLSNRRILAQQGTFVAFDFDGYYYDEQLSLESIQKAIFKKPYSIGKQFLYPIIIAKEYKKSLMLEIKQLGYYESWIYPDLYRIGKQISKEIKGYFD